jgi:hypothetical protein
LHARATQGGAARRADQRWGIPPSATDPPELRPPNTAILPDKLSVFFTVGQCETSSDANNQLIHIM